MASVAAQGESGLRRRLTSTLVELWLPVVLFTAWWFLSEDSTSFFFPPLQTIVDVAADTFDWAGIQETVLPSLLNFVAGFALAAAGGIAVGLLLGLWRSARRATEPTIDFLRSIPPPALISVMIILLGFGNTMKITAIAFASFFPILLNTIDGVRGVDPLQIEMAAAYRLRPRDRILKITLPAASPQIFTGLRVGLAIALAVMVFSEMFAGRDGLGFFIIFSLETYRIPEMYAGIIVIGILGYLVNLLFISVESRVLGWYRGWRANVSEQAGG